MEAAKDIFSAIGAIVGVLTGLVTLYAKYLDLKKKAAREARQLALAAAQPVAVPMDDYEEPRYAIPVPDSDGVARARRMVKGPAIALMGAGALSLVFNLLTAGYGFVDEFVTPLSADTIQRRAVEKARGTNPNATPTLVGQPVGDGVERATMIMTIVLMLSISLASAGAIWSGYSMLNLRSYWLSVAGSFAVMPGAVFCCLAGVPIGVWSLIVLLNPDVSESFR